MMTSRILHGCIKLLCTALWKQLVPSELLIAVSYRQAEVIVLIIGVGTAAAGVAMAASLFGQKVDTIP